MFKVSLKQVREQNEKYAKNESSSTAAINQFSAHTEEEWNKMSHGLVKPSRN